ncbi:MAG: phosphoglycerate mutase family protein [Steroidobacteraceae bacterium]
MVQAPGIARSHRSFFSAPLWLGVLLAILLLAVGAILWLQNSTTTIVLVRHADKELVSIDDPPLSSAGSERAAGLARLFGARDGQRIQAIYVSNTRRARETARPLADALAIEPTIYDAAASKELVGRILREHRGELVLVVGHSNTVPQMVEQLAGGTTVTPIRDDDYSNLYIVTLPRFRRASVLHLIY